MNTAPQFRWRWVAMVLVILVAVLLFSSAVFVADFRARLGGLRDDDTGISETIQGIERTWWWLIGGQIALLIPLAAVIFWQYRCQRREHLALAETARQLRENEELFHLISDHVSDFIEILDRDGRRIYSSASCTKVIGTPEESRNADVFTMIHKDDRERIKQLFHGTVEDQIVRRAEYRLTGRDGRMWEIESVVNAIRTSGQSAEKVLVVSRDITDRRLASARLERQNHALATLTHSPDFTGPDPVRTFRAFTETAARTLGVGRASIWLFTKNLAAIHCVDLYNADSGLHSDGAELTSASYPKYFAALSEGRAIAAHNARLDPRTAEFAPKYLIPLGISSLLDAPVRRGRRLVGVICIEHTGEAREWTHDEEAFAGSLADLLSISLEVREHRLTEAALRDARDTLEDRVEARTRELAEANERLKELDRLKSEFLAMMSHELRTPLNSILGFTSILEQELPGPLNPEQHKQLAMVHSAARHLLGLINDLLDLSRIESGRMSVDLETFCVADVVKSVTEAISPLAQPKALQIVTKLDPPGLEICSDRKKLFQVLLNLVNNAVKFTDHGRIEVHARGGPDLLTVSVSDTGIGIRAEQMSNLFQAFRQLDGSARRVYEGTGLGLHLSRKLLTLLGGEISVQSEYGRGSTFTFTLPLNPPHTP